MELNTLQYTEENIIRENEKTVLNVDLDYDVQYNNGVNKCMDLHRIIFHVSQ